MLQIPPGSKDAPDLSNAGMALYEVLNRFLCMPRRSEASHIQYFASVRGQTQLHVLDLGPKPLNPLLCSCLRSLTSAQDCVAALTFCADKEKLFHRVRYTMAKCALPQWTTTREHINCTTCENTGILRSAILSTTDMRYRCPKP